MQVTKEVTDGVIGILASNETLCQDSVLLTSMGGARDFEWKNSSGTVLSNDAALIVREPGEYTLEGKVGVGCLAQVTTNISDAQFELSLGQLADTVDIAFYRRADQFYHSLSGVGRQLISLPDPEGEMVLVDMKKGCFDCGNVTIEVRDTPLPDSSNCHKTIKRAWIARNECGKRSEVVQILVVKDQKPPMFVDFPADSMEVECGKPLPDETPRALDNSGQVVLATIFLEEKEPLGACDTIVTRFWRAVDECGNDTIRPQIILIKQNEKALLAPTPYSCGDTYEPPTGVSQNLRQTLNADEIILMYGFPVKLINVNGAAGTFSGTGLLTLPFGEKGVKVSFSNVRVNEVGIVLSGTMQAMRNPKIAPIQCPEPKEIDFCPAFTSKKDSLATELTKQGNGFKDCEWQGQPPVPGMEIDRRYDPYGFDCNGNYLTGEKVNDLGCTQSDMNDPNNSRCYNQVEPYAWLTPKDTLGPITQEGADLADSLKDELPGYATQMLDSLIHTYLSDFEAKRSECGGLRGQMRTVFAGLGIADSSYIFGSNGQYIKEGMWKEFSSAPKTISNSIERKLEMENMEKLHVDLYGCDQEQEKRQSQYHQIQALSGDQNKGELIQWLKDQIQRLPADSVKALNNQDALLAWIKRKIDSRSQQPGDSQSNSGELNGTAGFQGERNAGVATYNQKARPQGSFEVAPTGFNGIERGGTESPSARANRLLGNDSQPGQGAGWGFIAQPEEPEYFSASTLGGPDGKDSSELLLPLTIDNIIDGKAYAILLDNISFDASLGGKLDAYLRLPAPGGKDTLYFQALNVPFTPGGADYQNARLKLACDAPLRLNNIAQLKVLADDQTYVEWDCNGFSRLRIGAEIEFCRNVLVPYDGATLKPLPDSMRLKATLQSAITNWDGFTMGLTFSHPFGISEDGGFVFRAEDAYIDMSDTQTPEDLQFPENYPFSDVQSRNLWRGFYMKQFAVYLPQELDKNSTPRGLSLSGLIIDDGGVTVSASIPGPILPLSEGNLGGWAFSIDSVLVKILRNHFAGAGFGGLINIPLLNRGQGGDVTPEDCVRYSATIETGNKYNFSVQPASSKKIGMWFADLTLQNSSRVEVNYQDNEFVARAILNGSIQVNSDSAGLKVNIPELRFQGLTVSSKAPYFDPGVWDKPIPKDGVGAGFNGFSLGVDNINAVGGENPGLFFHAHMDIGPENGGLAVEGGFKLKGKLDVSTGRQRWLPDGIQVDQFSVRGEVKGIFKVDGFVDFFEENPAYGNGFWGGLDAELLMQGLKGAGIKAVALFGATNTPESVKYFLVDAMGMLPSSTPSIIRGFGGGVWNRMEAQDTTITLSALSADISSFPIGQSLSGIKYQPSASAGLGLKAALRLGAGEGTFDALVSLNAQFSAGGGLDEMSMSGLGTLLKKNSDEGGIDTTAASIRAGVYFKYSFSQKAFDGRLDVNVVVPNALTAQGTAKIFVSNEKWYIHIGTPQNPIQAALNVPVAGGNGNPLVSARMYLDLGSELPPLAGVPSYFRDLGISSAVLSSSGGKANGGVMFGIALEAGGDFTKLKPVYATLRVSLGADLALIDYGDAICASTGRPLGIDGWYASGQVYAYVNAAVGLVFKQKKFPIADLSVGAILQGRMPNPVFARGALAGKYKILGGLIKGKFNLQFTIGQDCGEVIDSEGNEQSLEQNYQIIAAVLPDDGSRNVPTTGVPSAQFRFPINGLLESYDDQGNPVTYLVELDGIPLLTDSLGNVLPASLEISQDGNALKYTPYDAFSPNSTYTFLVKVKYSKNGTILGYQEKQVTFTTGRAETTISEANIAASYPIGQMMHFYPGEFSGQTEFIQLVQGQDHLFYLDNKPVAILVDASGRQIWQGEVTYTGFNKRISFDFPNDQLRNGQCYTLEIRRLAQIGTRSNDQGQLPPGLVTSIAFCVSEYHTFLEKARAFTQQANKSFSGYEMLLSGIGEGFDDLETGGAFGAQGLVRLSADFWNSNSAGENWYLTQETKLYKNYIPKNEATVDFQFIPKRRGGALPPIAVSFNSLGKGISYRVLSEVQADYLDFIGQVVALEREVLETEGSVLPDYIPGLKTWTLEPPPSARYPLRLTYAIPGMSGTSSYNPGVYYGVLNPE